MSQRTHTTECLGTHSDPGGVRGHQLPGAETEEEREAICPRCTGRK